MKAKPYKDCGSGFVPCAPAEATHVMLNLPGPLPNRMLPVIRQGKREGTPCWSWNGDTERPTLKPSILTRGNRSITDEEAGRIMRGEKLDLPKIVCHSFVNDGRVQFLGDCTHEHAGKTLELLEVEA